ncbi:MAG: carboxypeptidase regulatory-like domain-containing protein [bacterium]|nr:carboxypeptidase regulatory-like domain-containing protein [bacterium]
MEKRLLAVFALVSIAGLAWWLGPDAADEQAPLMPIRAGEPVTVEAPPSAVEEGPRAAALDRTVAAPTAAREGGIQLTVLGAGEPLAGARVRVFEGTAAVELRTDTRGACALPLEAGEGAVRLFVEAPGFFHRRGDWQRLPELTIELRPTTVLYGRVLSMRSLTPVANARITLSHPSCPPGCASEFARTAQDGSYELAGMPLDLTLVMTVTADDHAYAELRREFTGDGRIEHDILLDRGARVAGTVVDYSSGAPVPGASVVDLSVRQVERASADEQGRFESWFGVEQGSARIEVSAPGYCRLTCVAHEDELSEPLLLRLVKSVPVRGRVTSAAGGPVAGAEVRVDQDEVARMIREQREEPALASPLDQLPDGWSFAVDAARASTSSDGSFTIEAGLVPWSEEFRVRVRHTGFRPFVRSLGRAEVPGEAVFVSIELQLDVGTGTILGTASLNGEPAPGHVSWLGATRRGTVELDAAGGYRIEEAEAGEVELSVSFDGLSRRWQASAVQLERGAELRHDFVVARTMATLSGHVRWEGGEPALGLPVSALASSGELRAGATTQLDGSYSIDVEDTGGTYDVFVGQGPVSLQRRGLAPGTRGIDFVMPRLGTLRVRVTGRASGETIGDVRFAWRRSGESGGLASLWGAPDQEGWYELALPIGLVDLHVRAPGAGYAPAFVRDVRVGASDAPGRTEVTLEAGVEVTFRAAEPAPEGATILLLEEEAWGDVRFVSGPNGSFWDPGEHLPDRALAERVLRFDVEGLARIRGLGEGRYRLKLFRAEGWRPVPERIEVRAGGGAHELAWDQVR